VAEIRVIDNGSLDGTLDIVQRHASHDPRVRFVGNPDNPGFAAANNQGVADSHSPWLAFINPDLMVEPDTLAELRSRAEALGDCLLGVEQVDEHGHADEAVRRRDPDFLKMLRSPGRARSWRFRVTAPGTAAGAGTVRRAADDAARAVRPYRWLGRGLSPARRGPGPVPARARAGAVVAIANDLQVTHVRGVSSRSRPFFVEWHKHRAVALLPEVRGQAAFAAGARGGMGCDLGACADAGAAPAAQVV
jgi:glycosyltransferase involved in cell wall biosynthesis